jgi:hypothetical protein
VVTRSKPRYVDVANPAMAIDCPNCGLRTARFLEFCSCCGSALWPNGSVATAAFLAWRDYDPQRAPARRYDLAIPVRAEPPVIDYTERAHRLGIHLLPGSNYPFPIAAGMGILFIALALAAAPFTVRIGIGVVGALVLLYGVIGWVVLEDTRNFPSEALEGEPEINEGIH